MIGRLGGVGLALLGFVFVSGCFPQAARDAASTVVPDPVLVSDPVPEPEPPNPARDRGAVLVHDADAVDLGDTVRVRPAPLPPVLDSDAQHSVFVAGDAPRLRLIEALGLSLALPIAVHSDTVALGFDVDAVLGADFRADGSAREVLDAAVGALGLDRWDSDRGAVWLSDHALVERRAGPAFWGAPGGHEALEDAVRSVCAASCQVRMQPLLGRVVVVAPARVARRVSRVLDSVLGVLGATPLLEAFVAVVHDVSPAVLDAQLSRHALRSGAGWAVHATTPAWLVGGEHDAALDVALHSRAALSGALGDPQRLGVARGLAVEVIRKVAGVASHVGLEVVLEGPADARVRHTVELPVGATLSLALAAPDEAAHSVHWLVVLRAVSAPD